VGAGGLDADPGAKESDVHTPEPVGGGDVRLPFAGGCFPSESAALDPLDDADAIDEVDAPALGAVAAAFVAAVVSVTVAVAVDSGAGTTIGSAGAFAGGPSHATIDEGTGMGAADVCCECRRATSAVMAPAATMAVDPVAMPTMRTRLRRLRGPGRQVGSVEPHAGESSTG